MDKAVSPALKVGTNTTLVLFPRPNVSPPPNPNNYPNPENVNSVTIETALSENGTNLDQES